MYLWWHNNISKEKKCIKTFCVKIWLLSDEVYNYHQAEISQKSNNGTVVWEIFQSSSKIIITTSNNFFFCSFTEIFFHATVAIPELHHIHSLFILSNQKMFFSHVLHFILRSLWCSDRIEFNLDLIPSIDKGKFCQGLSSLQCVICLD